MSFARIALNALLSLQLLLGLPALAQLAPSSPWKPTNDTDFLNLYQASTATAVNAEILLLIDQSGSTSRLMFHQLFPNNWLDEKPPNGPSDSQDYTIIIRNSDSNWGTSGGVLTNTLSVGFATDYSTTSVLSTISASGHTYYIGGARGTSVIGGVTYPYNTLIKPDGTEVTAANVTASGGNLKNAVAWMLCASHVRLRLTRIDNTTLTVPRDVDFPLFYKPIDSTATISTASGLLTGGGANIGGLTITKAADPLHPSTPVMFDLDPTTTQPVLTTTSNQQTVNIYGGRALQSPNVYAVRSRYIEWVFVGKDPASPSGAYYCIPNAIPSSTSDKSVQRSIDPASITYDGGSDTFSWTYVTETTGPSNVTNGWYPAFSNKLPNRNRLCAIKEAVCKSYLNHQGNIFFAWRQLYDSGATPSNALAPGDERDWGYINSASDLSGIASISAGGETPLVESLMSAYCQMTNPQAFQAMITAKGYTASQLECLHHFVLLCTDGAPSTIPNNAEGSCSFPYLQTAVPSGCSGSGMNYTAGTSPVYSGNSAVKTHASFIDGSSGSTQYYWNTTTLAGIAAHGGDGSSTTPTWIRDPKLANDTGSLNSVATTAGGWLPFWVTKRYAAGAGTATTLAAAQPIQTMTVGVSLGADYLTSGGANWDTSTNGAPTVGTTRKAIQNDRAGSKFRLMSAALVGDPGDSIYDITNVSPFYLDASGNMASDASYYFDGRDPSTLVNNLDDALTQINFISGVSSTAAPVFPNVGAGLGNSVYIAKFAPPPTAGPLWNGDLEMFPTKQTSAGTILIDSTGAALTGSIDAATPQWSAASAISTRGWLNRKIFTRPPSTSALWNTAITQINLGSAGTDTSSANAGYTAVSSLLPGTTTALKLKNLQFVMGADVGSGTAPLTTRSASIMGDVINSAPSVLQYSTLPTSVRAFSTTLANAWDAHAPSGGTSDNTGSFRVIFVGTNQGLFHAFGEVDWVDTTTSVGTPITKGVVDELWAFLPTELLPNIDQLQVTTNKHVYAVDGQPTVYLLDLPQSTSQATGNGVFDVGSSGASAEKAVVVFGLGKGGRSYYAINVADPCNPTMNWALCPNEQYNYPTARVLSGAAAWVGKMGLATSLPTMARVYTSLEGTTGQIVDIVLLGGGFSDPLIEAALPATAVTSTIASLPATGTALGRGAIALDVVNGKILHVWDTSGTTGAGPVPAGVVPLEIVSGAAITSRGYFTDYYGSLWRLGGTALDASPRNMFRLDTGSLDSWNVSQLYVQQVSVTGGSGNGLCTTLPSPFLLSRFPYTRTVTPLESPFTVGVSFNTGDRNNPLDKYTYTKWAAPTQHRMNVFFDRQDINTVQADPGALTSAAGIDANPTSTTFFLKTYYGYYINFASPSGGFIPKGITSPLVLDFNIFYSYFNPTTASCAGGTGTTSTYQVCNVMVPIANATAAATATAVNGCKSGLVLAWTGVASSLAARNIVSGVQAGLTSGSGTTDDTTAVQNLTLQNLNTQSSDRYPKIRVWRIVH